MALVVKDSALSLLYLKFDLWPENFHVPLTRTEKKKKKKKNPENQKEKKKFLQGHTQNDEMMCVREYTHINFPNNLIR